MADCRRPFRLDDEPTGLLLVGPRVRRPPTRPTRRRLGRRRTRKPGRSSWPGPALRGLEPALADGLAACRLEIGYPVAPASATRAYAALAERLGVTIVIGGGVRSRSAAAMAVGRRASTGVTSRPGRSSSRPGPWTPDGTRRRRRGRRSAALGRRRRRSSWSGRRVTSSRRSTSTSSPTMAATAARPRRRGVRLQPRDRGRRERASARRSSPPSRTRPARSSTACASAAPATCPAIAATPVVGLRICARPVSPDGRPLVGAVPGIRNAFVAAGHGPWGISTGPGSARLRRGPGARGAAGRSRRRSTRRASGARAPGPAGRTASASSPGRARRTRAATSARGTPPTRELQIAPLRRRRVDEAAIDGRRRAAHRPVAAAIDGRRRDRRGVARSIRAEAT